MTSIHVCFHNIKKVPTPFNHKYDKFPFFRLKAVFSIHWLGFVLSAVAPTRKIEKKYCSRSRQNQPWKPAQNASYNTNTQTNSIIHPFGWTEIPKNISIAFFLTTNSTTHSPGLFFIVFTPIKMGSSAVLVMDSATAESNSSAASGISLPRFHYHWVCDACMAVFSRDSMTCFVIFGHSFSSIPLSLSL